MKPKKLIQVLSFRKSVFFRLFAFHILILLLALGTILSIWIQNITQTAETLSSSNITDVFSIVNSSFTYKLDTLYAYMDIIALNDATQEYLDNPCTETSRALREYLDTLYFMMSDDIQGFAVMNNSSLSFGGYAYFTPHYKEYDWYSQLLNSDGSCTLFSRSGTLSIGKSLKQHGQTVGILICELNKSFLNNIFGIRTVDGALRTIILDENENVIYSNHRVAEGEDIREIIETSGYRENDNILLTVTMNGKNYKMISHSLNSTPVGWVNITYLPQDYVYRNYNDSLQLAMTCVTFTVLVSVIFSYIIIVFWKNRLNKLYKDIEQIDFNQIPSLLIRRQHTRGDEIDHIYDKIYQMTEMIATQVNTISRLEEKKHHYEIQILKNQINPHLIYNTLNTIQTLAKMQKNTRIDHIAGSLSHLLLYSTVDLGKPVPLNEELEHVRAYVDIMQNKFLNDIELQLMIDPELQDCMVLKVLLQPIVENSIKHGFRDTAGNYILIKAYRDEDNVILKVIDNGKGIEKERADNILIETPENTKHLGLQNINRRIKLFYGDAFGLQIISIPKVQTTIILTIPYLSAEACDCIEK